MSAALKIEIPVTRTLSFLDETGDTMLAWEPQNDDRMIEFIQKKMDEGVTFWIVKGFVRRQEVRVTVAAEALANRKVMVKDADAMKLLEAGIVGLVENPDADAEPVTTQRARSAQEAARSDTIAHRPLRGG